MLATEMSILITLAVTIFWLLNAVVVYYHRTFLQCFYACHDK